MADHCRAIEMTSRGIVCAFIRLDLMYKSFVADKKVPKILSQENQSTWNAKLAFSQTSFHRNIYTATKDPGVSISLSVQIWEPQVGSCNIDPYPNRSKSLIDWAMSVFGEVVVAPETIWMRNK